MKVELIGFPGKLEVGCERYRVATDNDKVRSEDLTAVVGHDQVGRLRLNF